MGTGRSEALPRGSRRGRALVISDHFQVSSWKVSLREQGSNEVGTIRC